MQALTRLVQDNCHISDAQYAGNYTLCIYLLKMREFYRWEHRLPFNQNLDNSHIGKWLTQREALWDEIDTRPLSNLTIKDQSFDLYDSAAINQQLEADQLVYSGGYGLYGKPVFFLAELEHKETHEDFTLYVSGKELARDLSAPPGMTQNKTVYIRRESLRRFIWEKFEESYWHKQENPLSRALTCYDFKNAPQDALEQMTDNEVNTVLHHEIGEIMAGKILGEQWEAMLMELPRSQAEMMARAVRDNIADMQSTLPKLIENDEAAQIHFYFANLGSLRKMIFPRLQQAYSHWLESKNTRRLSELLEPANEHWVNMANQMLGLYQQHGANADSHIQKLISSNYL
jgi:hypothetical protein